MEMKTYNRKQMEMK